MKTVEKFEAYDGKTFETRANAEMHERLLKIREWYDENAIYSPYAMGHAEVVDFDDLLEWLGDHQKVVKEILVILKKRK
jgi:hypothetical protein